MTDKRGCKYFILRIFLFIFFLSWFHLYFCANADAQKLSRGIEYLNEGIDNYENGRYEEAIITLNRALAELPEGNKENLWRAYFHLGICYLLLGENDNAEKEFKNVLRIFKNRRPDPEIYSPKIIKLFNKTRIDFGKLEKTKLKQKKSEEELFQIPTRSKIIKLKFANFFPSRSGQSIIWEEFCSEVEKLTYGRIKIQYFAGGSLLKAPYIYKGIEAGIADIGYSHIYYTPGSMPVTEALGLPLGYPSSWVSSHVANDFYKFYKPKEFEKVKVLLLHGIAPSIVISKKPVEKLEDLKRLTIRAPGVPGEIIKALGGTPANTPMMEVYNALAKGVNDGVFTPFETLKTFRFAEVVGYSTACWQVGNTWPFYLVMNKNSYNKLPPYIKKIINVVCEKYKERLSLLWNKYDLDGKDFALRNGVKIIELSQAEVAKWRRAIKSVILKYVKDMIIKGYSGAEVRSWIKFIQDGIEYWTKKQISLGIKSPTGPSQIRP